MASFKNALGCFLRLRDFGPCEAIKPHSVVSQGPVGGVFDLTGKLPSSKEGGLRFLRGEAPAPHYRLAKAGLQFEPSVSGSRCAFASLVRHLDGLAEMRDRLLEGRAAQRLVAGLAPPFDRVIGEPSTA